MRTGAKSSETKRKARNIQPDVEKHIQKANIPDEMRDFMREPLSPDPFVEYSFPFYREEIMEFLAGVPRQGFGDNCGVSEDYRLFQQLNDGQIDLEWALSVPDVGENAEDIANIYYKIERFVMRPTIKRLIETESLSRGVSLGTLSDIAKRIKLKDRDFPQIIEAFEYGANIRIKFKIESKGIKFEEQNLLEKKTFQCFNVGFIDLENPDKNLEVDPSGKTLKEKRSDGQSNRTVFIYPSPTYLTALLEIEKGDVPDNYPISSLTHCFN